MENVHRLHCRSPQTAKLSRCLSRPILNWTCLLWTFWKISNSYQRDSKWKLILNLFCDCRFAWSSWRRSSVFSRSSCCWETVSTKCRPKILRISSQSQWISKRWVQLNWMTLNVSSRKIHRQNPFFSGVFSTMCTFHNFLRIRSIASWDRTMIEWVDFK